MNSNTPPQSLRSVMNTMLSLSLENFCACTSMLLRLPIFHVSKCTSFPLLCMLSKRLNARARESTAVSLAIESFAEVVLSLPFDPPPQAVERANNATVKIGIIFLMGNIVEVNTYLVRTRKRNYLQALVCSTAFYHKNF